MEWKAEEVTRRKYTLVNEHGLVSDGNRRKKCFSHVYTHVYTRRGVKSGQKEKSVVTASSSRKAST